MSSSLTFTSPTAFLTTRNRPSAQFEVPQYLIAAKVFKTSGRVSNAEALTNPNDKVSCTFSKDSDEEEECMAILDFGFAVAGTPTIHVTKMSGSLVPIVINVSYSEGFPGIERLGGDGPFPFSAGADTLRRTRFRIRSQGFSEAKHVQGSQRWMKITLVSKGPCSVSLSLAAFKPCTITTPLDHLPGYFECSDTQLSELWKYGARTLQLNCIPVRTVPPPWQISEDIGILVDSQRCNSYGWGSDWTDYEMEFEGMIVDEGISWSVRVGEVLPGLLFVLNLSTESEIAILEQWYGYYNKPQTTLTPVLMARKELERGQISRSTWYRIKTVCVGTQDIHVYFDSTLVGTFAQGTSAWPVATGSEDAAGNVPATPHGSIGFGAGEDQLCRFRNLQVTSIPSGVILYASGLNNPAVLGDFGIGWNQLPYIFDGAKRDRYAWTADIITGGPSLYCSTAGYEFIKGNIEASMLRCVAKNGKPGLLPGGTPPGREFERGSKDTMFNVLTINYSLYLIMVLYDYWLYTGDDDILVSYWDRIEGCIAYIDNLVNADGLICVKGHLAADYDYYNGLQEGVSTKRNALYVAALKNGATMAKSSAVDDRALADVFERKATRTTDAINKWLFNEESGHYNITTTRTLGFQQETHAWLVLSNIAPSHLHQPLMEKFKSLYAGTHNQSPTQFTSDSGIKPTISPITSTFHILAALKTGDTASAEHVLRRVWEPMCNTASEHFTGTTWEFLLPDGTPFEDQFCSYAQLFSAGPTFILSRFVLGVEPLSPGFKTFLVEPRFPITGVMWAQGRVPTPAGPIFVRWQAFDNGWRLWCKAPAGFVGKVVVPKQIFMKQHSIRVNDVEAKSETGTFEMDERYQQEIDIQIMF